MAIQSDDKGRLILRTTFQVSVVYGQCAVAPLITGFYNIVCVSVCIDIFTVCVGRSSAIG